MTHTHRVLIVEDDYAFRWSLAMRCQKRHIDADVAESMTEAHELMNRSANYCGVMLDLRMGPADGTTLLEAISRRDHHPHVVVVTGFPDVWERVSKTPNATLVGTTIFKPADVDHVIDATIRKCV